MPTSHARGEWNLKQCLIPLTQWTWKLTLFSCCWLVRKPGTQVVISLRGKRKREGEWEWWESSLPFSPSQSTLFCFSHPPPPFTPPILRLLRRLVVIGLFKCPISGVKQRYFVIWHSPISDFAVRLRKNSVEWANQVRWNCNFYNKRRNSTLVPFIYFPVTKSSQDRNIQQLISV